MNSNKKTSQDIAKHWYYIFSHVFAAQALKIQLADLFFFLPLENKQANFTLNMYSLK